MVSRFLIRKFIKNYQDIEDKDTRNSYIYLGGIVGIACNLILTIIKVSVGFISGSVSILADGFNNLSDMTSSLITMIGMKLANRPADKEHPFGHGRIEYISALIVIFLARSVIFSSNSRELTSLLKDGFEDSFNKIFVIFSSNDIKFSST